MAHFDDPPHAPNVAPPASSPSSADAYDALAELFLGEEAHAFDRRPDTPPEPEQPPPSLRLAREEDAPANAEQTASSPSDHPELSPSQDATARTDDQPRFEGLILGHLPSLPGAWALAYAGSLAARSRRPVALASHRDARAEIALVDPGQDLDAPGVWGDPSTLGAAAEGAARRADRWIIRTDAIDEPTLAASPRVDALTLLTGADEAAVVSAYRTLKALAASFESLDHPPPSLRVAIMGAAEGEARDVIVRLTRAAATFLRQPLEIAGVVPRIGAVPARRLYEAPSTDGAAAMLETLDRSVRQARERSAAALDAPSPRSVDADAEPAATTTRSAPPETPARRPGRPLTPHIPTLRALEPRCPWARDVELAADESGGLHLLVSAREGAMRALTIAEAWAREHAELLRLACRSEVDLDLTRPVERRLFASDPSAVRRLLDAPIRVHLLTEATPSVPGWVCTPLN